MSRINGMNIKPAKRLEGTMTVPGDKSISHRAAIFAAMADGPSRITNYSTAEDCRTTLRCLAALGVLVSGDVNAVVINGVGKSGFDPPAGPIDCGNSGTTVRLLAGVLAGQRFDSVLTGDASLRSRPMGRIIEPLRQMGATIESPDGRLPMTIRGRQLHGIRYVSPVASAQVKSCLLLAGLLADGTTTVVEPSETRDHTERMLGAMGIAVHSEADEISVDGAGRLAANDLSVPGDISSAAFFIAASACLPGSDLVIENVGINPTRTAFLSTLERLGADIDVTGSGSTANEPSGTIRVRCRETGHAGAPNRLSGPDIPGIIDEIPVMAVWGTQVRGGLEVRGAGELRLKESDRITMIVRNLRRMGADIEEHEDGFTVHRSELKGALIDPAGDHRIAMAFAVAGLFAEGETEIADPGCVDISFPGFFDTLESVARYL